MKDRIFEVCKTLDANALKEGSVFELSLAEGASAGKPRRTELRASLESALVEAGGIGKYEPGKVRPRHEGRAREPHCRGLTMGFSIRHHSGPD